MFLRLRNPAVLMKSERNLGKSFDKIIIIYYFFQIFKINNKNK